ncbi:UvrD-helicase domain-containing protein [Yersinia enterocolitica]|nr:UvrD-helicase domain-containing protein [Yersinia enterocolitica]EKN3994444.1 UvrD-helicase domain-containing protein [Yersinia enterocolitica]EKN5083417.1 RNA helicase [Yersinia enterocolitica]EKN6400327.1 RNA helicase [Yersinia enterocolitica]EKP3833016.1 UvrD-helicase domain-containing protein [Yersinia enterocolitica]
MTNILCIAGAGSGKTEKIISEAIEEINSGGKVLVVTYTTSNQQELRKRFILKYGKNSENFIVKGLFTFYLEDMIRPHQKIFFQRRIDSFVFDERNPHLVPGGTFYYTGRQEYLENKTINPAHYLTSCRTKAHSGFLAKLATRIAVATKNKPAIRLSEIYTKIYFDEVQDLIGWDYDVIDKISKIMKSGITCVGDFRQTLYDTTFGHKAPQTAEKKLEAFKKMRFTDVFLPANHRCIQEICYFADEVHKGLYPATVSAVREIPAQFGQHVGVYIVKESDIIDYIATYEPVVLRWSVSSGNKILPVSAPKITFGNSKGLGFDRVLVVLTPALSEFILQNGYSFPASAETNKNKMYVAITRARYSLAFIVNDAQAEGLRIPVWKKPDN